MLDGDELAEVFFSHYKHTAFRLEQLPAYEVESDHLDEDMTQVSDYDRYLAGESEPIWERKQPYLDLLNKEREQGKYRYRVRILGGPDGLHPYERYECEWGYVPNTRAGEGVFILDRSERRIPPEVVDHDFWLLDDETPLRMHYHAKGEFVGATIEPDMLATYRKARDAAMAAAEPFATWWARNHQNLRVPAW